MRAAYVLYNGLTVLDFIGFFDALYRLRTMRFLPDFSFQLCAQTNQVHDEHGLTMLTTPTDSLHGFDLLVVPGGFATRTLQYDAAFIRWLQTAADCPLKASVCSGALLLGAAGFLTDCAATTHPSAYEQLRPYCREVRTDRIVDEGSVITARGVSSSLDLGLHLVKRLAGAEAQAAIRRQMDYPY